MIEVQSEIQASEVRAAEKTWAGIDIHGKALRYAAIEGYREQQRRLLRLGRCDFDFEVAQAIYQGEAQEQLDTISEALQDALARASIEQLHVIFHPPDCFSFFTPVPSSFSPEESKQRLQEEASLLAQTEAGSSLRLTGDALYDEKVEEEQVRWYHVLAVEEAVWARLERLLEHVSVDSCRPMLSMHAVGRVMTAEQQHEAQRDTLGSSQDTSSQDTSSQDTSSQDTEAPYGLAIGWYPRHVEFSLCRKTEWRFSHFTSVGSPADCAYFAVALLNRTKLTPQDVGRLYLYGDEVDTAQFDLLQRIFGVRPRRLSAMPLLDADTESFTASFNPEAYATCIGAAL